MKRIFSFVIGVLMLSIPINLQAQGVFVSSDATVIMTVPAGWTVIENDPQIISAESEDGISATITYGEALALPSVDDPNPPRGAITILTESEAQARTVESPPLIEQLRYLPDLLNQEAILSSETIRGEDFYHLMPISNAPDVPPDTTESVYFVESEFTGVTRIAIIGSDDPIVEMLTLYYAYDPPAPVPFDCSAVELVASNGVPGAVIDVLNLPSGLDDFEVQAVIEGFEEPVMMFAYATPDEAYLIAPIYPDFRLDGGLATIQMMHNGTICNEFTFTIDALPRAEGETQRYLEALQAHIDATVEFFGITSELLYDTDIPEFFIPIASAQYWVDHPDNPQSLVNILETASPEELELADALIANDGYVDALNNRTALIQSQPPLPEIGNTRIPLENQYVSNDHIFTPFQPSPLEVARQVSISNAEELSYYMRLQAHYQQGAETVGAVTGAADTANNAVGTSVAFAQNGGAMTAGTASRLGFAGAVVGTVTFTANSTFGIYQHLLPSEFTSMSLYFDKPRFQDEDEDDIYQLEKAWVNVKSRSFSVSQTGKDALLLMFGNFLAARGIGGINADNAGDLISGKFSEYATVDNAFQAYGMCGDACSSNSDPNDDVTLGPYFWKGIEFDFTDEDIKFLEFGIVTSLTGDDPSIEILSGDQKNQYRAIDDGLTVVGVRLLPQAFGGNTITERARIFVDRITIYTDVPVYGEPNQQVCATATRVDHALDETLEWEFKRFDSETPLETAITFGDAPHQFCFTMPEPDATASLTQSYEECIARERAAYLITAESNTNTGANTGAREYNGDEQRISVKAIYTVDEQNICEGLWEVTALRDDENFCDIIPPVATPRGPFANLNFIMERAIEGGGMNSLINIDVLNNGDQLRVEDVMTGESRIVDRLEEGSNIEDLRVEIILQEEAQNQGDSEQVRVEQWEQGESDGEIVLVRAPSDSTLWLDGQRYRAEVPQLENIAVNGARSTEPHRVNTLFVSPELFISVVSWRYQGEFSIEGVSYEFDCDIDVVGLGQLITGEPEDPEDDPAPPTDDDAPPEEDLPPPADPDGDDAPEDED